MDMEEDVRFYSRRLLQELCLAALSVSLTIRILHLNMAACYATMREHAVLPHLNSKTVHEVANRLIRVSAATSSGCNVPCVPQQLGTRLIFAPLPTECLSLRLLWSQP
jgi:hypothetical protein